MQFLLSLHRDSSGEPPSLWEQYLLIWIILIVVGALLVALSIYGFSPSIGRKIKKAAHKSILLNYCYDGRIETVEIKSGECFNAPFPERSGYSFLGWFNDTALSIPFNGSQKTKRNFTLYAKWEKAAG